MRISVKYISPLDIVAGHPDRFQMEMHNGATGTEPIHLLAEQVKHIPLVHRAMVSGGTMLLVNQAHTEPANALKEGDKVSVVLRISGIDLPGALHLRGATHLA